ncbi:UNVERIFIED_CONTAM: hypothetical protein HDU68_007741 [Siphonaria sp. JEL0065]|nr:hypothetical protein HDU68_007741 [Siphonaria sp. JEL0065]
MNSSENLRRVPTPPGRASESSSRKSEDHLSAVAAAVTTHFGGLKGFLNKMKKTPSLNGVNGSGGSGIGCGVGVGSGSGGRGNDNAPGIVRRSITSPRRSMQGPTPESPEKSIDRRPSVPATLVNPANAEKLKELDDLRSNLRNINKDLEDIARMQQHHISQLAAPGSTSTSSPLLTPLKLRSRSLRSIASSEEREKEKSSRNTVSSFDGPEGIDANTPIGSESRSLKSARSFQSVDSRTEQEYLMLLEEQGRNPLPLKSSLEIPSESTHHSLSSSMESPTFRPQSSATQNASSVQFQLGVSKKLLEETERAVLCLDLGEGYPNTTSLMLGEGGRLLLPSERKKLEGGDLAPKS